MTDLYQRPYGTRTEPTHAMDRGPAPTRRRGRRGAGSRPNAGVEAAYRQKLEALIGEMNASVLYWMTAAYRQHEPVLAMDTQASPSQPEPAPPLPRHTTPFRTLLNEARQYDREGYSFGLRRMRIIPDRDKWHSFFDFGRDEIVTEAKFWRAPPGERLHMFVHEIGHRGQSVDRPAFEAFKRAGFHERADFEHMANRVHLVDEREGHTHNLAEEVFAESYARWCLGLPMPDELREFWDGRVPNNDAGNSGTSRNIDGGSALGADSDTMAFDRTPASFLRAAFARLRKRWEQRFDEAAERLAGWFAQTTAQRSDEQLRRILKDGGLSVRFTPTAAMRDVMQGTVQANVALIKSIPEQYLTQVEGAVFRSVQTGRDLSQLTSDLREQFGVTKRRAKFIALDQNNKATAAMTRARQVELGMQAVWVHSHAGKEPRRTHLANDGETYDPEKGWYDPDPQVRKRIWPGELINCRCFSRTMIPGFKP